MNEARRTIARPACKHVLVGLLAVASCGLFSGGVWAGSNDAIRIGLVEPLSGPAAISTENLFDYVARINARGGVLHKKLELVPMDNKLDPQESLLQLQKGIDDGVRVFMQSQGSSVGLAITDFVRKYNTRNPGKEVLYLNYDAVDPALTNEKCSFWHFRVSPGVDMRSEAIADYMKDRADIHKVYLLNQDYTFGQSVRSEIRKRLATKRPDIEIVGDDVVPMLKVSDFSPYIAKIRMSGADTVITGNWGADISLLLKAAGAARLGAKWFTFYGDGPGVATAVKQAGAGMDGKVFVLSPSPADAPAYRDQQERSLQKYGHALFFQHADTMLRAFARSADAVGSLDINKVALNLEGMKIETATGDGGFFRADDHQFIQPLYVSSFGAIDAAKSFEQEGTGWGWHTVATIPAARTVVPTTCKMKRPS